MPKSTGTVAMVNKLRDIFMKSNFWKILVPSNTMGANIINIKGIVIKDKQAVIVVKETDKATFPPANLVI